MEMMAGTRAELLGSAFDTFNDASLKLIEQYRILEKRVEDLSSELNEKNKVMERTRRLAAMGEMAAKIAHEIRNPLGSIAIYASLLERELSGDGRKRLAEHVTKGVKALDTILSNMLLFAGAPEARLRPVDVREAVSEALEVASAGRKKGVRVSTSFEGDTVIPADRVLLTQLFVNLLINSLDAMDEGDSLTVRTSLPPGAEEMVIEVEDTGSGIPEEALDRIFDPFFSTKARGTGLGMAIVSAVVDAHKGSIDVKSRAGEGTRAVVRLPAKREG